MLKNGTKKKKVLVTVITAVVVVILGILSWIIYLNSYRPSQNIYFLEYENEREKNDTIIFKYDADKREVKEIGRVSGYLYRCVINKEESCITGFFREGYGQGSLDIVQYDLETGIFESKNVIEKINKMLPDVSWGVTLYDEGNKILIHYTDEEELERLMSYDIATEENTILAVDTERINQINKYLAVDEKTFLYICGRTLYRYDWETQTETKITDSSYSGVLEPSTGLIAYTKDINCEKIYLYDIEQEKSKCIAAGGWNTVYGDLSYTNAGWSRDGEQFLYVKYLPWIFDAADTRLMVYDIQSGRRCCIYKAAYTSHNFSYILGSY